MSHSTEEKHTPGPWEVCDRGDYGDYGGDCVVILGDDCMKRVAVVFSDEDAHLVAAVPDLLEALKQALEHIEVDETTHGRSFAAGNVARAAIAKATGGAS